MSAKPAKLLHLIRSGSVSAETKLIMSYVMNIKYKTLQLILEKYFLFVNIK